MSHRQIVSQRRGSDLRQRSFFRFSATAILMIAHTIPAAFGQSESVWDGVYTEDQAARGASSFSANCARCHTAGTNTGEEGRALTGDPFWQSFRETTVDYYFDYIQRSMPNGAGGSLSSQTYLDVVAYLLRQNGLPAGSEELTEDSATGVLIIAEDGPGELPDGTLVHVVGCLERGEGNGWVIQNAAAPVRAETDDNSDDMALGTRSYELMFVLIPLDAYAGHTLRVRGLLIGEGGVGGINVSTTESLSESCG